MRRSVVIFSAILSLLSAAAFAGAVVLRPVSIVDNGDGTGDANGSMSTARFSANDVEYIGCTVYVSHNGSAYVEFGNCQAVDHKGNTAACTTDEPKMIASMRGLADYSEITFGWDREGACTGLIVSTQSFHIP